MYNKKKKIIKVSIIALCIIVIFIIFFIVYYKKTHYAFNVNERVYAYTNNTEAKINTYNLIDEINLKISLEGNALNGDVDGQMKLLCEKMDNVDVTESRISNHTFQIIDGIASMSFFVYNQEKESFFSTRYQVFYNIENPSEYIILKFDSEEELVYIINSNDKKDVSRLLSKVYMKFMGCMMVQ